MEHEHIKIPYSCDGCTHYVQSNQPPFTTYCNRGGVPMSCGFGCDKYEPEPPVYKRICNKCGHVMRHNDDDQSVPEIVNDDGDVICATCHSNDLSICCNWCNRVATHSEPKKGGTVLACDEHKDRIVL